MIEKLSPIESNRAKIYEFSIKRPLSEEEKRGAVVLRRLQKAGFESYFVGGGVRDELMGEPAHDIDVATSAKPEEIEALFQRAYDRGKQFGVMAVQSGKYEFEVATFRSDIGIFDHRRPKKVAFTSAEEDSKRRDFTINGLFYDPEQQKIVDYVGGVEDLQNQTIRFIGEPQARIDEDYLRMLRAVRFSCGFGFKIDDESYQAIAENVAKINQVSSERIRDELTKMFINENRCQSLNLLSEIGLLKYILPEAEAMKNVSQPPEFHSEGDVWTHTLMAMESLRKPPLGAELAWTVLLHDIAKPQTQGFRDHPKSKITFFEHDVESSQMAEGILKRLKFSNEFIDACTWAISQHMRIIHAFRDMSERKQKKLFTHPHIDLLLDLTRADLSASLRPNGKAEMEMYEEALKKKEQFEKEASDEEKEQVKKFTLITGHDIMETLNLPSGPKVGEIKAKIEEAFLEEKISTRKQALEMIGKLK